MLFNSYIFILLFLPVVLVCYYALGKNGNYRLTTGLLLLASLCFVGYQSVYSLMVLLGSVLINFCFLKGMEHVSGADEGKKTSKGIFILGIVFNIGILLLFKYFDFIAENINMAFGSRLPLLDLALPLGISFYTFAQIACLTDCYKGDRYDGYSLGEYAAFVSFFPKFIQGPIAHHSEIIDGFRNKSSLKINYVNMCKGIYAFALGLAKKVLIADTLAKTVNIGYNNIAALNSWDVLLVMVCYSLQIYFDFSGYCDMAYGIGYMLNMKLPINFNSPYKAETISDFWDRWHITLTGFFTRYLYIPLGGSRRGRTRTLINIMIVFLLSGLWHGANWTFILWGALNGIFMVFERVADVKAWRLPRLLKQGVTFAVTTFAWSIFRADSLSQVWQLWNQLFTGGFGSIYKPITEGFMDLIEVNVLFRVGAGSLLGGNIWILLVAFIVVLLLACFFMKNTQEKVEGMRLSMGKMAVTAVLMIWSIMSLAEISEFIYFNF
ncbi:MAG: MBOAT family O-acyltransferase [Bacillota bacterium]|nr:MBOAT family O-acyltransferase [Bacillota bacterium]